MTDIANNSADYDRFTMPGDIPDGVAGEGFGYEPSDPDYPRPPVQDWLARGLRSPAGRGWESAGGSDAGAYHASEGRAASASGRRSRHELAAERGRQLREQRIAYAAGKGDLSPFGGGKMPYGGYPTEVPPGVDPMLIACGPNSAAQDDIYADSRVFDLPMRVRFLDVLASCGEVSGAARHIGVSRETVYRARRRYADFAALWDAALVHARARAEGELATRAFQGVDVPVFHGGVHVATWRKHEPRYLFAHLERLDRRIAQDQDAVSGSR